MDSNGAPTTNGQSGATGGVTVGGRAYAVAPKSSSHAASDSLQRQQAPTNHLKQRQSLAPSPVQHHSNPGDKEESLHNSEQLRRQQAWHKLHQGTGKRFVVGGAQGHSAKVVSPVGLNRSESQSSEQETPSSSTNILGFISNGASSEWDLSSGPRGEQLHANSKRDVESQQKQRTKLPTLGVSSYLKNVANKCRESWSPNGKTRRASKLSEMIKKRCFLFVFIVSLFLMACFLTSLVISRSVGQLDQEESAAGAKSSELRSGEQVFEVRQLELVDLVECDKTFAYTRWRLQVRLPQSAPVYAQHNRFASAIDSTTATHVVSAPVEHRSAVAQPLVAAAPPVADAMQSGGSETGERYFLTATGESELDTADPLDERESKQNAAGATRDAFDPLDPVQLAVSELNKLSPADAHSLNSSLIDCFIVDTDKRYEQRTAIEAKHRQVASTRRVEFAKMLAVIQACRRLTWTTLGPPPVASQPARVDASARQVRSSQEVTEGPLVHAVKPVERRKEPQVPDPLGGLLSALALWNQSPVVPSTTTVRPKLSAAPQASVVDTRQLLKQPSAADDDDEARRAGYFNMGMSMISGIVPNTLWCGLGDRAANYSELGSEYHVDSCCRAHDHCPIRLKPFSSDYGLINWSMSTRSHCDCDLDFNDCLTQLNTTLSNVIKTLYFRFVGLQCIDTEAKRGRPAQAPTSPLADATTPPSDVH